MKPKKKEIAPKLANGDWRVDVHTRLPDPVKYGLKVIAKEENRSVSWVMERVIIKYFGIKEPKYKRKKNVKRN